MLTTGLLFEQRLRTLLKEEIEHRKDELSYGNFGVDYQRAVGVIQGLREALDLCDAVAKEVMQTL